jgi:HD-like signal output (HDOD) protein
MGLNKETPSDFAEETTSGFAEETTNGFESLIQYINELPPLPQSVQKIQSLYADGEPDLKELVKHIESDPILTADILARANAPVYSFSKNILSVMQAITLFGSATVRGFVLSSAVNRHFEIDMQAYSISNDTYVSVSNLQSALMFQWYMSVDIEHVKFLAPIAFLMETGKVIIAKEVNDSDYSELFKEELKNARSIEEAERLFAGRTSAQICALLFEHWYFDASFIMTMQFLDDVNKAPLHIQTFIKALNVVRRAVNINEQLSDTSIEAAAQMVKELGYNEERFVHAAQRLQKKLYEKS